MKDYTTVWQFIKENWIIKKSDIKNMGINPDKDYLNLTLEELNRLADFMDVRVGDIV